jgi:hypothetical protein
MGSVLGRVTEEVPAHEVLVKKATHEIRHYAPCVLAATPTLDHVDGNNSFGRLAKYIGAGFPLLSSFAGSLLCPPRLPFFSVGLVPWLAWLAHRGHASRPPVVREGWFHC